MGWTVGLRVLFFLVLFQVCSGNIFCYMVSCIWEVEIFSGVMVARDGCLWGVICCIILFFV